MVAGEIGNLATQTSESTKQIEGVIKELIENSKKSIKTMDEVKAIIEQQNEYVVQTQKTSASTSVVNNMMEEVSGIASKISGIAENVQKDVDVFVVNN